MSHTPGPWKINPEEFDAKTGNYYEPYISAHDDLQAAPKDVCIATVRIGLEGSHANAALIAAAPDLFSACKAALIAFGSAKHFLEYAHPATAKEYTDAWTACEKAIAKAEGEL